MDKVKLAVGELLKAIAEAQKSALNLNDSPVRIADKIQEYELARLALTDVIEEYYILNPTKK